MKIGFDELGNNGLYDIRRVYANLADSTKSNVEVQAPTMRKQGLLQFSQISSLPQIFTSCSRSI